jgi:hypothetical protein
MKNVAMSPSLAVVIPAFNAEKTITGVIERVPPDAWAMIDTVFVALAQGISECERLESSVRAGILDGPLRFNYHPHVTIAHAVGFRLRRNYVYLLTVGLVAWLLKLEVHPVPAATTAELVRRAAVGTIPGTWVMASVAAAVVSGLLLALRAPSEQMLNWAEVPSPYQRWMSRTPFRRWGGKE